MAGVAIEIPVIQDFTVQREYFLSQDKAHETERLAHFHEVFKHLFNNELLDPAALKILTAKAKSENRPIRIADLGTGTVSWAMDVAKTFKAEGVDVEIDGYDITDVKFPTTVPDNISLKIWDVNEPPSDDIKGKYDYVHMRLFIVILPIKQIPVVLDHVKSLLTPGGYLDWSDASSGYLRVSPGNPCIERSRAAFVQHLKVTGKDPYITDHLESWIKNAGYENVRSAHHSADEMQRLPLDLQQTMTKFLVPATYTVLRKLINSSNEVLRMATLVKTPEEVEEIIAGSEKEFQGGAIFTIPVSRFVGQNSV
ncbi:hypothetical protein AA313_de0208831 [Arthrobotrys entomopaga]|nr:hypothetical protein AA313_de0208831 [Arthrobotrys entomopaga]